MGPTVFPDWCKHRAFLLKLSASMFKAEVNNKTIEPWILQFVVKYYLQSLIYNHLNIAYILGWEDLKILDTHRALALFPKSSRACWGAWPHGRAGYRTRARKEFAVEMPKVKLRAHVGGKLPQCPSASTVATSLHVQQGQQCTQGTKVWARELFQVGPKHFQ